MLRASTRPSQRGPIALALALTLSALALVIPAAAGAVPTVKFSAKILPIPHFPHTGNILGAGASLEVNVKITGTEYDFGHPLPLRQVNALFPKGTKITTKGFPTCSVAALERGGPPACKKAAAGPAGLAEGVVNIGGEAVHENTTVSGFFVPGGLDFFIEGDSPAKIEKVSKGHWVTASAPYGPELVTEVPLIETFSGAPDASAESIHVKSGAAIRKGKKTIYYGTVPKTCPKGGFPAKIELFFGTGESKSEWEKAVAEAKVPCPPKKKH
ncbi:MAG: hypothetical protein ACYDA6_10130 [Solirubrobacteraceae bacterium]